MYVHVFCISCNVWLENEWVMCICMHGRLLELLVTYPPRSARESNMPRSQTFGLLAASSTNWQPWGRRLKDRYDITNIHIIMFLDLSHSSFVIEPASFGAEDHEGKLGPWADRPSLLQTAEWPDPLNASAAPSRQTQHQQRHGHTNRGQCTHEPLYWDRKDSLHKVKYITLC